MCNKYLIMDHLALRCYSFFKLKSLKSKLILYFHLFLINHGDGGSAFYVEYKQKQFYAISQLTALI